MATNMATTVADVVSCILTKRSSKPAVAVVPLSVYFWQHHGLWPTHALPPTLFVQEPEPGNEADTAPDVSLSVRWGWGMADIFAPEALEADVCYDDHQIFWQRNVCADGIAYVQGVHRAF